LAIDTQVTSLVDMRLDFQFRLREVTGVTETNDATDRMLNTALQDIHVAPGNYVPWAVREATLITHAPYDTGTVAIDVSSSRTAVTGTSTTWNTSDNNLGYNNARVGGRITFAGDVDIYDVSAVGSDTAIDSKIIQFVSIGVGPAGILAGVAFIMSKQYGSKQIGGMIIVGGIILLVGMYVCYSMVNKIDDHYITDSVKYVPILFMVLSAPVMGVGAYLFKLKKKRHKQEYF